MGRVLTAVATCAAMLATAACGGGGSTSPAESRSSGATFRQVAVADAPDVAGVVAASDEFGLAVLAGADATDNLVFSPASAFIALAMLAEGATNAGAEQLDALLGSSGAARSEAINALAGVLAPFDGDPGSVDDEDLPDRPLVHVANNVVLDERAEPSQGYLDRLATYFDAGVQVTDLSGAEGTAVLDAWVREHTGGRIERSAIVPSADLLLVLQNAILFAAAWQQQFDPSRTDEGSFTAASGKAQTADFMSALWDLPYAQVDGWSAIELPYREGFAARFVLPPVGADPARLDAATLARLGEALDAAAPSLVEVSLPRFETDSTIDLSAALRAQGVSAIFDPATRSLEGISSTVELFVGQAVQQATITVGEEGTVAAAVTEIGVATTALPPTPDHQFIADRPFLMVVQESSTGWDLFQTVVRSVG